MTHRETPSKTNTSAILYYSSSEGIHVEEPQETRKFRPETEVLERFSNECRKTKTKVITPANHNKHKLPNQPIRTGSKYMSPASSAGKRVRASRDWFEFYF